jgi:hypothetical protein
MVRSVRVGEGWMWKRRGRDARRRGAAPWPAPATRSHVRRSSARPGSRGSRTRAPGSWPWAGLSAAQPRLSAATFWHLPPAPPPPHCRRHADCQRRQGALLRLARAPVQCVAPGCRCRPARMLTPAPAARDEFDELCFQFGIELDDDVRCCGAAADISELRRSRIASHTDYRGRQGHGRAPHAQD